jgi:RNA polymerase sigma-70 factor (ECF subfamily)
MQRKGENDRHYSRNMKVEHKYYNIHQALIDRCRRGDSQAQFEIYRLYYKAMFNTCLRIVGDATDAEDVMQESFFKAFDKINTYRNEVSFGAWLKQIVVNSSLDFLKKKKLNTTSIDEVFGLKADEPVEKIDFEPESIENLKRAIMMLPEGYRLVINLVLVEGYSHEEVSQMLGISPSTSRSQLTRAKQRLLEILSSTLNI